MTRPELVTITRADLRVGDRLRGEPNALRMGALTVETITKGADCWEVRGRDDEGHEGPMFIIAPDVLIEPRPAHVIEVISEHRMGSTMAHKWTCSCGKTGRRWYYDAPVLARLAGSSHTR